MPMPATFYLPIVPYHPQTKSWVYYFVKSSKMTVTAPAVGVLPPLALLDQVARVEVEALVVEAHPEAVVARVAVVEAVTKSVLRFR